MPWSLEGASRSWSNGFFENPRAVWRHVMYKCAKYGNIQDATGRQQGVGLAGGRVPLSPRREHPWDYGGTAMTIRNPP